MEYKDYYKILGVSKDATEKEIKAAYRRLARKYHPDLNPGDKKAEERFKEINEAHEVLTDPEKRRKYDQFGAEWQRYQQAGAGPGGFDWGSFRSGASQGPYTRVEYFDLNDLFGGRGATGQSGFSDFFEFLFGGMGRTSPWQTTRTQTKGQDIEHPVDITLEEAYAGATRILEINGRRLEVKIPPGVKTGSKVRVPGEGARSDGGPTGDLFLKVNVLPHKMFERDGDDLHCEVPVDIYTAALGGEIQVPTLKGTTLSLRIPPETQSGKTFRLAGQGMPKLRKPNEYGDLYVKVRIVLPTPLTERERQVFEELARLRRK